MSSRQAQDPGDEAFLVEGLLIAANASFTALSQFATLWHDNAYGESPSGEAGEEQTILEGYEAWLGAAGPLHFRVKQLTGAGILGLVPGYELTTADYESETIKRFEAYYDEAKAVWNDELSRRQAEREALRTDQLAELAARLIPRQASYDEEGTPP